MSDLISREAALNATKMVYIECLYADDYDYEEECDDLAVVFAKDIKAIPAVDAKVNGYIYPEDGFCSYAERKDNGNI